MFLGRDKYDWTAIMIVFVIAMTIASVCHAYINCNTNLGTTRCFDSETNSYTTCTTYGNTTNCY